MQHELCPPNPNELEMAAVTLCSTFSLAQMSMPATSSPCAAATMTSAVASGPGSSGCGPAVGASPCCVDQEWAAGRKTRPREMVANQQLIG